jgi:rod shape-determining protein MreD
MSLNIKKINFRFIELFPVILIVFISLNGSSTLDLKFFAININYIIVYFWTLRNPNNLGYGFIFLAGIISDVVFGLPLGVNALSLLIVAAVAAYIRVLTVRITLINDWISFIPAILIGNFIYFFALYFSDYSVDYLHLFINSIFTFSFYPIFWGIFILILNVIKS